jgi:hypothetical protein
MASTAAAESEPAAPGLQADVETAQPSPELPAIDKDAHLPLSIEPALPLAGAGAEGQTPATQDEITLLLSPSGREYAEAASADAEVIRTVAQAKLRAGPNPSRAQGELLALLGNPNTSSTEIEVAFQAFEVEAKENVRFAWSCACLCRPSFVFALCVKWCPSWPTQRSNEQSNTDSCRRTCSTRRKNIGCWTSAKSLHNRPVGKKCAPLSLFLQLLCPRASETSKERDELRHIAAS